MTGEDLAAAATGLIGTRFRLGGRDPAQGLDCIGLLQAALTRCGRTVALPHGYTLRINNLSAWLPDPERLGFAPTEGPAQAGDVVLCQPGPAQFHLAIRAAPTGWIHAHAGLRKVVRQSELPDGPILHHWRLAPSS